MKPQYDHIIQISKGGPDAPDNIQLTHAFCNKHKHDGDADVKKCMAVISREIGQLIDRHVLGPKTIDLGDFFGSEVV